MLFDPESGRELERFESDCHVCGVTWSSGQLWHCAWTTRFPTEAGWAELRRLDPRSGRVERRLRFPTWVSGIEADGQGKLWCGTFSGGKILVLKMP